MSALIRARLTPQAAHEAMITGRRYGGGDALAAGIVDRVADEDKVRETALDLARPTSGRPARTSPGSRRACTGRSCEALRRADSLRLSSAAGDGHPEPRPTSTVPLTASSRRRIRGRRNQAPARATPAARPRYRAVST